MKSRTSNEGHNCFLISNYFMLIQYLQSIFVTVAIKKVVVETRFELSRKKAIRQKRRFERPLFAFEAFAGSKAGHFNSSIQFDDKNRQ